MGERDKVILSEWEWEQLAAIEEELAGSDPRLTRRLTGARYLIPTTVVLALALMLLGGATAVATFTRWLWLAVPGLCVMAAGMALMVNPVVARLGRYRHARSPGSPD